MGDDKDWQKQLLSTALMAAVRTAIDYATNPDARDETVNDVKARLAEVDYSAAARAVSGAIDQLAESSKSALNQAIDSIRANAEDAVEAAAEKAQEQLGARKKRGRGKLFFGILVGIVLGFVILNEDRRNQLMDKLTGANGPIDTSAWNPSPAPASGDSSPLVDEATTAETSVSKTEPASSTSEGSSAVTGVESATAQTSAASDSKQDTQKITTPSPGKKAGTKEA